MILTPSRKFAHAHIAPSRDKHRRFFKGLPMCVPSDREPRFADEVFGQFRHRRRVADVAWCQLESDNPALVIEHQMQFEAKEPAGAGFAACRQSIKNLVTTDPAIMAHDQRRAVDVIDVRFVAHAAGEEEGKQSPYAFGQSQKTLVTRRVRKVLTQQSKHYAVVKRLEVLEVRAVV